MTDNSELPDQEPEKFSPENSSSENDSNEEHETQDENPDDAAPNDDLSPESIENYKAYGSAEVDTSAAHIEKMEEDLAKAKEQMLRALADAENTRRRSIREREDAGKYAIASFAKDLLDFSDNFSRAMASIPDEVRGKDDLVDGVISGIDAMGKELLRTFQKHGIEKIEPMDEIFDPHFHEVMFQTEGTGKPAGTIIQIVEPGYIIQNRLLRPARVGVAKDEGQGNESDKGSGNEPGSVIDEKI